MANEDCRTSAPAKAVLRGHGAALGGSVPGKATVINAGYSAGNSAERVYFSLALQVVVCEERGFRRIVMPNTFTDMGHPQTLLGGQLLWSRFCLSRPLVAAELQLVLVLFLFCAGT